MIGSANNRKIFMKNSNATPTTSTLLIPTVQTREFNYNFKSMGSREESRPTAAERYYDKTTKQHKRLTEYAQEKQSMKLVQKDQFLQDIMDRIELSEGAPDDVNDIVTSLVNYRYECCSREYWRCWIRLLERFPDPDISLAQMGISSPQSHNMMTELHRQERNAFCDEIVADFNTLRVMEDPKLEKPKNPNRRSFYKIKVGDPHHGQVLEDNDLLMLLKWENGARLKDPECQTILGNYYFTSCPEMTRWWYKRASILDYPEAIFRRGFCYEFEHAVEEQDFKKAKVMYARAAAGGHTPALNQLGSIMRHSDPEMSFEFFAEAARRGDLDGMCNIGLCSLTGKGIEQDFNNAVTFLSASAKWNHPSSLFHLGNCAALGIGIPAQLSLAVRYWGLGARAGCYESAYNLAKCFYEGICVPKNHVEAFKWFQISAKRSQPFAVFWEGLCHRLGHGTPKSEGQALECFTKAARLSRFLRPELQVLLHGSLQDQNFDVGFLQEEEAAEAEEAAKAAHRMSKFRSPTPLHI